MVKHLIAIVLLFGASGVAVSHADTSPPDHRADVAAVTRWWTECLRNFPATEAAHLQDWVTEHPDDGESLFLLSRVARTSGLRDAKAAQRCVELLKAAAATKHPAAMAYFGWALITGDGATRDLAEGSKLIDAALATDDTQAHMIYGAALSVGVPGIPPDYDEAIDHLKVAVERGDVRAPAVLWLAYDHRGRGADQFGLLRQGAAAGDPQAQAILAKCCLEGRYVPRDLKQAEQWGKRAAEVEDPQYQRSLGEIYIAIGTPEAQAKAIRCFVAASDGGDIRARYWLGVAYTNGAGSPGCDPEKGMQLLREAAEKGVSEAELAIAQRYLSGLVVPRDVDEARRWYERAAAHGENEAKATLRILDYAEQQAGTLKNKK